jgi:hypothetical protein
MEEGTMSEDIKAIGRRISLEVSGQGRLEVIDEVVAPDSRAWDLDSDFSAAF